MPNFHFFQLALLQLAGRLSGARVCLVSIMIPNYKYMIHPTIRARAPLGVVWLSVAWLHVREPGSRYSG